MEKKGIVSKITILFLVLLSIIIILIVYMCIPVNHDIDVDGDGYRSIAAGGFDCDDGTSAINPGATEVCDGLDNDCDGTSDEGFPDDDRDGIGNTCDVCPNDPDNDADADGVCGDVDDCSKWNPIEASWTDINGDVHTSKQRDYDLDTKDDACDNCPGDPNLDQTDTDNDGRGDLCDGTSEAAPPTCTPPNAPECQGNPPGDPCPNDTDDDSDGDGYCTGAGYDPAQKQGGNDNCPNTSNPSQTDADVDNRGNLCDKDNDGDGYCEEGTTAGNYSYYAEQCTNGAGDCNDNIAGINPEVSTDISDGIDNDCDGLVDEDVAYTIRITLTDASDDSPIAYDTWLPDTLGQQIKVIAKVYNGAVEVPGATFDFSVVYESNNDGMYINDTSGITTSDFDYVSTDLTDGNDNVTLTVKDYAATIHLNVIATSVPGTSETPQMNFVLPKDTDTPNDWIPDAWESRYGDGDLDPAADDDNDGINNGNEYRGARWGKLNSCINIKDPEFSDSTLPEGGVRTALIALCDKYQTEGYLPTGITHMRLDPTRRDLFVKYSGYGTFTYTIPGTTPPATEDVDFAFGLGSAYYSAGIDVHAADKADVTSYGLGNNNIDIAQIDLGEVNEYSSGHISKTGKRKWEFAVPGVSCKGDGNRYGDDPWHHTTASPPCDATGTNVYRTAIYNYVKERPYIDGNGTDDGSGNAAPVCMQAGANINNINGILESIDAVDDKDDDGLLDGGEDNRTCDDSELDGDRMIRPSASCAFPDCAMGQDLSGNDIESDGRAELPRASDPGTLTSGVDTDEFTIEQIVKHVTTHELGHTIGMPHNSVNGCLMYEYTTDWKRDGTFSATALADTYLHNDNLFDRPGGY
jgi:hypothetical protein